MNVQKNIQYQLIIIRNYNDEFEGVRQAYNSILDSINYEKVVFCHHDIFFLNEHELGNILRQMDEVSDVGVVGIAGCKTGEKWEILSTMYHGYEKVLCGTEIECPVEVQCLDECLFIMKKSFVQQIGFSEIKGWHLYAVEQCIRANAHGLKNYVVPANVYHYSSGNSLDPSYINSLLELKKMYSIDEEYLNTTVKQWDLKTKKGYCYIKYYYWKQIIKKLMKKIGILKG